MTALITRPAGVHDAGPIAQIYNEGIEDGSATFETRARTAADVSAWFDGTHPIVVVAAADRGEVLGFAATFTYRPRDCYAGIAEFSVYVRRSSRGTGVGRAAMDELIAVADAQGYWKLVSRVLEENVASRALLRSVGFREVGVYRRHARLNATWRNAVIVERLLGPAASEECTATTTDATVTSAAVATVTTAAVAAATTGDAADRATTAALGASQAAADTAS